MSKVPSLLVAMPQLEDPNFHQSVVLMLNHDETGSFGVVVNRPTELVMGELELRDRTLAPVLNKLPVWYGGPVEAERIMFLVRGPSQPLSSVVIADDIYLGGTLEFIAEKMTQEMEAQKQAWDFRAYSGYSGWTAGQLDQELAVSSWLLAPFDPQVLFATPPEAMWARTVKSLGLDPSQLATETSWTLQ